MPVLFQYPLVDRVGFEGRVVMASPPYQPGFSILWWIELVLRGETLEMEDVAGGLFQYPLVDRVGFEG